VDCVCPRACVAAAEGRKAGESVPCPRPSPPPAPLLPQSLLGCDVEGMEVESGVRPRSRIGGRSMRTRSSVPASAVTYSAVSHASVCAATPRWWCPRPRYRPRARARRPHRWIGQRRRAPGGRATRDPSGAAVTAADELSPMATSGKATAPRFKRPSPRKKHQLCSRRLTADVAGGDVEAARTGASVLARKTNPSPVGARRAAAHWARIAV
jgi:hypothetical protein